MAQTKERRIRCDSSSAAETVADVEELLTKILVSVPPRSLVRFKCVSKHWLTLISDPGFFRRQTHQKSKISGFFSSKTEDEFFKSIALRDREIPSGNPFKTINDSFADGSKLRILQSCNGLFLCHIPIVDVLEEGKHHPLYVVNPTTNQFRALSCPSSEAWDPFMFVRYALAFNPSKSPHYKVICVNNFPYCYDRGQHEIDIYSSETGEWKRLEVPFFPSPSDVGRHHDFVQKAMHFDYRSRKGAVYCNGAVHWIRDRREAIFPLRFFGDGRSELVRNETDVLHYFDIGEERLGLVSATPPVPLVVKNIPLDFGSCPTEWPRLAQRYFGESGGHLYLIETYQHCKTQFDVMEMERDYSGWFVKYHVDLNPLFTALPDSNAFVVLSLSQEEENDNEEDYSGDLLLHMPGKVLTYSLRNKAFKKSVELANKEYFLALDDEYLRHEVVLFPYIESLACVGR
ncbi:putative F-box domain-containing protein [Rosa chinensis]|uniref:Putative F-box domain-containing protein n=1 Tax=Rosa chinensis TaxID=74649 RepID=A0A2P6QPS9_ROSCH|nr:F-box protein At5g07610 [Rosa chinensis]PRQ36185.1 putative F-box domain-containing protein [Rosa chinensis]